MSIPEAAEIELFYLQRLQATDQAWQDLCAQQRSEIQRLQTLCNELQLQNTMQRAKVAEDLSQFCQRFAATTVNRSTTTSSSSSFPAPVNGNLLIPLRAIMQFLSRLTDGMVPDVTFTSEKRL